MIQCNICLRSMRCDKMPGHLRSHGVGEYMNKQPNIYRCWICVYSTYRQSDLIRHVKLKHGGGNSDMNISSLNPQASMHHSPINSGNPPQYSCVPPQQSAISTHPLSVPQPMGQDGGVNPSLPQRGYAYNNCNGNCALQNKGVHSYPEYGKTMPPNQYSESVNTEYDSLYSIDSEDDMGLEGIRLKGLKILNEFDSMLDEFIECKRDWAKVCRSIKQSEYNSKKDKMAVIEIMGKCVQLSV